jgi:hypothetical protein
MQALLGKIVRTELDAATEAEPDGTERPSAFKIEFKPVCVLPRRTEVPEWLKEATLTIKRAAPDPREIGRPGDSLVCGVAESEPWLNPLTVHPAVTSGELPPKLTARLRWWKDENPPEITVRAGGNSRTYKWTRSEGATEYTAEIETAPFFSDFAPTLPVTFEIASGSLKQSVAVLPEGGNPTFRPVPHPEGERHWARNPYLAVEALTQAQAGGIISLREIGRDLDHFDFPRDVIHGPLEFGGHSDRLKFGWEWHGKVTETAMSGAGSRRDGDAARLTLEGSVEDSLSTGLAVTLYDDLPLLRMERDFRFGKPKEEKEGDKKGVKEPVDDLKPVAFGFRSASQIERDGRTGSRILAGDGERLVVKRPAGSHDFYHASTWRLRDGWAMVEHPRRRSCLLYLFDTESAPNLALWAGQYTLTLEPSWHFRPVRPGNTVGFALALAAGELAGAGSEGAWVACRTPHRGGGVLCAVIARLRPGSDAATNPTAAFRLDGETRVAALERMPVAGVGTVYVATALFEGGTMASDWDVTAAGMGSRREIYA